MKISLRQLENIAHGLGAGRKTLKACMRILKRILAADPQELDAADFADAMEKGIDEKVLWDDVRLPGEIKERIMGTLDSFIRTSMQARGEKSAISAQKGLLLSGFPGTGKTYIAKALANEKNCYFRAPTLAELKGEYVGQSSALIKKLFAELRANEPSILFIDEADTVFPGRQLGGNDRDSFGLDMVNQFLQEIDGAKSGQQKIFLIAASNRPDAIDSAICSRLGGKPVEIPLPNAEIRGELFDAYINRLQDEPFSLRGKFYEEEVLKKSDGMAGRDIQRFVAQLKDRSVKPLKNDEESRQRFMEEFKREEEYLLNGLQALISAENIIRAEENKFSFNDFIGLEQAREELNRQVKYMKSSRLEKEKYRDLGIKSGKGLLLYGPSGNGKSFFAECAAGEHGFHLIRITRKDLAGNSPMEEVEKLQKIFTESIRFSRMLPREKGVLLFFDEFETLAGKNSINPVLRAGLLGYLGSEKWFRHPESRILFVAAASGAEDLDDAVTRRGRIDYHIYVPNPDKKGGIAYLQDMFAKDSKISLLDRGFAARVYDRLASEKRKVFLNSIAGNLVWHKFSEEPKEEELARHMPSIADLAALIRQLKESAFWMNSWDNGKLRLDMAVLNQLMPEN